VHNFPETSIVPETDFALSPVETSVIGFATEWRDMSILWPNDFLPGSPAFVITKWYKHLWGIGADQYVYMPRVDPKRVLQ
jgi:hypothetical protein